VQKLIQYFRNHEGKLLKIDSIGALLSMVSLLLVSKRFQLTLGIPKPALLLLLCLAMVLVGFSLYASVLKNSNFKKYLRLLGLGNLAYCLISMAVLIKYATYITGLGFAYLLIEIALVAGLSFIELAVAK
jgi:hypothetical protein